MTDSSNPKDAFGAVKPNLNLVPPSAIAHEATAMMDGARKYGPYNWREKDVLASIYVAAAMRHVQAWFDGEENAQDSGRHHLGHARACLGILLDAQENGGLKDDRPKPGNYSVLVERLTTKSAAPPAPKPAEEPKPASELDADIDKVLSPYGHVTLTTSFRLAEMLIRECGYNLDRVDLMKLLDERSHPRKIGDRWAGGPTQESVQHHPV